jgi:hypothetical protein
MRPSRSGTERLATLKHFPCHGPSAPSQHVSTLVKSAHETDAADELIEIDDLRYLAAGPNTDDTVQLIQEVVTALGPVEVLRHDSSKNDAMSTRPASFASRTYCP